MCFPSPEQQRTENDLLVFQWNLSRISVAGNWDFCYFQHRNLCFFSLFSQSSNNELENAVVPRNVVDDGSEVRRTVQLNGVQSPVIRLQDSVNALTIWIGGVTILTTIITASCY